MTDDDTPDTFRLIINELRDYAKNAHGDPAAVHITKQTLSDWADALERRLASSRTIQLHRLDAIEAILDRMEVRLEEMSRSFRGSEKAHD